MTDRKKTQGSKKMKQNNKTKQSRKKQTKKLELEAHYLYSKEEAMEILGITEKEFDELRLREHELRCIGEIAYSFEDLWPLVHGEEYKEPETKTILSENVCVRKGNE